MSEVQDLSQDQGEEDEPIVSVLPQSATDRMIEREYEQGRLRVVQDKNDFFLPHVVDFIRGRRWGNLRPEYQRRLRWDNQKKSRLIESFIMNVPVPPVFLYESSLGAYEVMDGQQRLNAVVEFLAGEFSLSGLKIWPSLNGRSFAQLPPLIRRGLERAKISAITLTSDLAGGGDDSIDLRAQVFDRLNTGGERLNQQELRNSLYAGRFNKMIVDLAGHPTFTAVWDIPAYADNMLSDRTPSRELKDNNLFKRMLDCEIVLRFFAFRDHKHVQGAVRSILDNSMKRNRDLGEVEVIALRERFVEALETARLIFGTETFRLPPAAGKAQGLLSRPLYDAQMVAIDQLIDRKQELLDQAPKIRESIQALASPGSEAYELIVGRANTASAILARINLVREAIASAIA
ncbi:DUF262 domain-containing protein [Novosphingobium sp. NPDC080210]|uniref:DUF262 domain-containing protein n=1 Tax=Novosphingobium sp. NPDC080210 TaxID=3390596 RepID=UPI003D029018